METLPIPQFFFCSIGVEILNFWISFSKTLSNGLLTPLNSPSDTLGGSSAAYTGLSPPSLSFSCSAFCWKMFVCPPKREFFESKSDFVAPPFPKSEPLVVVPPKSDPVVVVEFPKREPYFGGFDELPKSEPVAVPPNRLPDLGA